MSRRHFVRGAGPLASVATEDPALNRGPNKVTMWSYPIIRDGLRHDRSRG